ncbi:MAG: hypothetical protein IPO99_08675 [Nitrospira sp.]|nr:hypothetical protein [Nitrospira sp.]
MVAWFQQGGTRGARREENTTEYGATFKQGVGGGQGDKTLAELAEHFQPHADTDGQHAGGRADVVDSAAAPRLANWPGE